jgi:hypothetical protein
MNSLQSIRRSRLIGSSILIGVGLLVATACGSSQTAIDQAVAATRTADRIMADAVATGIAATEAARPTTPPVVAGGAPVATASQSLPDSPPSNALDGNLDTIWSAGSHPVQWIEIDLGRLTAISSIRLSVSQEPSGETTHQVWGGALAESGQILLHEFKGVTSDGDTLEFRPPNPVDGIRFVKIITTESPSWVAWREVEITTSAISGPTAAGVTRPVCPEAGEDVKYLGTAFLRNDQFLITLDKKTPFEAPEYTLLVNDGPFDCSKLDVGGPTRIYCTGRPIPAAGVATVKLLSADSSCQLNIPFSTIPIPPKAQPTKSGGYK